jgi:hypothetical protein
MAGSFLIILQYLPNRVRCQIHGFGMQSKILYICSKSGVIATVPSINHQILIYESQMYLVNNRFDRKCLI